MSLGNVVVLRAGPFGDGPVERFKVQSGTTASIKAGEPVSKALGAPTVATIADNTPVVGTDFLAGIAQSTSTEDALLYGVVDVLKITAGVVYICNPETPADWDTQAEYDAKVGDRVNFNLASGVVTIQTADGATNGLIVEPLDVGRYPGKVAFSIRRGASYDA